MSLFDRLILPFTGKRKTTADEILAHERTLRSGGYTFGVDTLLSGAGAANSADIPRTEYGVALASTLSIWAYRCTAVRMASVGSMDWSIKKADGTVISRSKDRNPVHPAARAIKQVRAKQHAGLFELWEQSLCIQGEAYVVKERNDYRYVSGLRWMNPLAVSLVAPAGRITHFQYSGVEAKPMLPADDVIYDLSPNPLDELRGLSPMEVALSTINIDANMKAFIRAYFRNNARLGMIFSPKTEAFSDDNFDALTKYIEKYMVGLQNAYRPQALNMPMDITSVTPPGLDDQVTAQGLGAQEILTAFGVPRAMAGDTDSTQYQAHDDILYWFFKNTIIPEVTGIADSFNISGMPDFDSNGAYLEFDTTPFDRISTAKRDEQAYLTERLNNTAIDLYTYQVQAGVEHPDPTFKGLYKVEGVSGFVPSAELPTLYRRTLPPSPFGDVLPPAPSAVSAPVLPAVAPVNAPPPAPAVETRADALSFCVALDLANHPDLIALQQRVRALVGDTVTVEWNAPADFHLTLITVPDAPDAMRDALLEAVNSVPVPELSLHIGSLRAFDSVGQYALHFRTRSNSALTDYQASLHEALTEAGARMSAFSAPADYIPHITVGYASAKPPVSTYHSSLTVSPDGIVVWHGDDNVIYRTNAEDDTADGEPAVDAEAVALADARAALRELGAWKKFLANGRTKPFEARVIDAPTAACIASDLMAAGDKAARSAVFTGWARALSARAGETDFAVFNDGKLPGDATDAYAAALTGYGFDADTVRRAAMHHYARTGSARALVTVRNDFERAALALFQRAQAERMPKQRFRENLEVMLFRYARMAMIEGYADGGIADYELAEEDDAWLLSFNNAQRTYIDNVANTLYADNELTDDEIAGKPRLWWNLSVSQAYNEGLVRASADAAGEFGGDDGDDTCVDCARLQGKVKRMSTWHMYFDGEMPPCSRTACGGYRCEHRVTPVLGKRLSRGALPPLAGPSRSTHTHDHIRESVQ
jgi:HK97 family phage portal protein